MQGLHCCFPIMNTSVKGRWGSLSVLQLHTRALWLIRLPEHVPIMYFGACVGPVNQTILPTLMNCEVTFSSLP